MDLGTKILSDITVHTKYAKYLPELHRRETWEELVNRNRNMHLEKYPMLVDKVNFVYDNFVIPKKVLPSMRSLQFAGKPIEVNPTRIFNCSYLAIDSWEAFHEIMFLLLGGTGVGYSVQNHHVDKMPEIRKPNPNRKRRYLVGDSIEGWADAIKVLIKSYFFGKSTVTFDYSDIRPKGALLVTSGGKAPGHEPLAVCIEQIRTLLETKNETERLSPIEIHDIICYIADAVLAGGIRRAALIALFSLQDKDMLSSKTNFKIKTWEHVLEKGFVNASGEPQKVMQVHVDNTGKKYYDIECIVDEPFYGEQKKIAYWVEESHFNNLLQKKGVLPWYYFQPQRGRANNSVVLLRHRIKKSVFKELWKYIEDNGTGEPGIYFSNDKDWGANPCVEIALRSNQFCVAGDTKLITRDGLEEIQNVVGKDIEIWNGQKWSKVQPYQTGTSDRLHRIYFNDGSYLDATDNHKFLIKNRFQKDFRELETLELIELLKTSKYELQIPRSNIKYFDGKKEKYAYNYGFILGEGLVYIEGLPKEVFSWDRESILKFIAGWADANGSNASNGIKIYGRYGRLKDGQLLLTKIGINSSLISKMVEKNVVWHLQITKTKEIPSQKLCCNNEKINNKEKYQVIKRIETLSGFYNSYCLTENELHQCVFNNVLTKQCNLVEVNGNDVESEDDFYERVKAASFLGTLQAGFTDFHYLREIWQRTTEKEALLGIGITGIGGNKLKDIDLTYGAELAIKENVETAEIIGINPAARVTCVKPSGTSSLVLGTSSGIHAWYDNFFVRRMRVGKNEGIYNYIINKIPRLVENEFFKPQQQAVISIPVKAPENALMRNESPIETLERVKHFNETWIQPGHNDGQNTHNISATINLKPDEWEEVGEWMWKNRTNYNGLSVIPYDNGTYKQAPFESITEEQYNKMVKYLADINMEEVIEYEDNTDLTGEIACSGGSCELNL